MPLAILRKQVKDLPLTFTLDDSMAMSPAARLSSAPRVVVGARISKRGEATAAARRPAGPVGAGGTRRQRPHHRDRPGRRAMILRRAARSRATRTLSAGQRLDTLGASTHELSVALRSRCWSWFGGSTCAGNVACSREHARAAEAVAEGGPRRAAVAAPGDRSAALPRLVLLRRGLPEEALGIVGGKAVLVNPAACIGHGACCAACPVDAIKLVFGTETARHRHSRL